MNQRRLPGVSAGIPSPRRASPAVPSPGSSGGITPRSLSPDSHPPSHVPAHGHIYKQPVLRPTSSAGTCASLQLPDKCQVANLFASSSRQSSISARQHHSSGAPRCKVFLIRRPAVHFQCLAMLSSGPTILERSNNTPPRHNLAL